MKPRQTNNTLFKEGKGTHIGVHSSKGQSSKGHNDSTQCNTSADRVYELSKGGDNCLGQEYESQFMKYMKNTHGPGAGRHSYLMNNKNSSFASHFHNCSRGGERSRSSKRRPLNNINYINNQILPMESHNQHFQEKHSAAVESLKRRQSTGNLIYEPAGSASSRMTPTVVIPQKKKSAHH